MPRIVFCVLALCASLAAQVPSQALRQSVTKLNQHIFSQVQSATAEVKQQADQVPSLDPGQVKEVPAQPTTTTVKVVDPAQKTKLETEISSFVDRTTRGRDRYTFLATTTVIIAAVLALVGGILSFLSFNKPAGIVSLVVAAVVAAPSIYPLAPLASFYRVLAAQGSALKLDCELRDQMTVQDFDSARQQLLLLILNEGQNRPQIGNAKDISEDLSKQLQVLRTGGSVGNHNP